MRVGRNIRGFGLSPGILRQDRLKVEALLQQSFTDLPDDLSGTYHSLSTMTESERSSLINQHFLFASGDKNLITAGMAREWPEARGIFYNDDKTFLVWLNEEDQIRIISMERGRCGS